MSYANASFISQQKGSMEVEFARTTKGLGSSVCCKPGQRNRAKLVLKLSNVGGDCAVIVLGVTPLAKSPATRMLIYLGLK